MRRSFNMLFQSVQMLDVLNTASAEQLMELHGIGVKRTQAIIETRQEGPFKYVLQNRTNDSCKLYIYTMYDLSRACSHCQSAEQFVLTSYTLTNLNMRSLSLCIDVIANFCAA